jgi:hypothetical protein
VGSPHPLKVPDQSRGGEIKEYIHMTPEERTSDEGIIGTDGVGRTFALNGSKSICDFLVHIVENFIQYILLKCFQ